MFKQLVTFVVLIGLFCAGNGFVFAGTNGGDDTGMVKPVPVPEPVPAWPIPVMKYVVASPRACLIGPPAWITDKFYLPAGDAENFPRKNGGLRVPAGTRVVFCLSRNLEGVWYEHSFGALATCLTLQWCKACKIDDGSEPEPQTEANEGDGDDIQPDPWVTIGRDGAKDVRKGPSIGRARVGVPVLFRRPGFYYLRAIVVTTAQPWYPRPLDEWAKRLLDENDTDAVLPRPPAAVDKDVIYIRVRVLKRVEPEPTDLVEPESDATVNPDEAHIKLMPKDADLGDDDLSADLNGDERVNLVDLAIFSQQWGKEYELPLSGEE